MTWTIITTTTRTRTVHPSPRQVANRLRAAALRRRIREARAFFLRVWPDGDDCHHDHARAGFRRLHA